MMKLCGTGRLTSDPELRYVGDNTAVCDFSLAVNEYRKGKDGQANKNVHFFDFTVWAQAAEFLSNNAKKGDRLVVEATPRQERWTDNSSGQKRSKTTFRLDNFELIRKNYEGGGGDSAPSEEPVGAQEGDTSF